MILDLISRLPLYENQIPNAAKIAAAFSENRPEAAGVEVREKSYPVKEDAARRFEVHYHTIDLMMARSGGEVIHCCPLAELTLAERLSGGADGRKLDGGPRGTAALLKEGYFCALFPGEAHMVGGRSPEADGAVSKWVVKVPCPEPYCIEDSE